MVSSPQTKAHPFRSTVSRYPKLAHYVFRPSLRLKTVLGTLILFILAILILALNAATSTPARPVLEIAKVPASDSLADSSEGKDIAQGKDAHLVDGAIQRSFEEPDFALLSDQQPHEIGCDVPLQGLGHGVLVFLGIFSAAEKKSRRDLYREVIFPDFPPDLVTIKFILGAPSLHTKSTGPANYDDSRLMHNLEREIEGYGDIVILPVIDNIDLGKTHEYFKWIAHTFAGEGRVEGRPRFVVKADDDTIFAMPNLISAFLKTDCSRNMYWGTSAGRSHYFGDYFRGLAYAMSWPLVSWIGSANMTFAHVTKIEDARTGQWLRHLDPLTDPIERRDMGWTMGDWNQLDVGVETVALHWCKLDDWIQEQHSRLLQIWSNAKRPYTWDNGVPPKQSIKKGQIRPAKAEKEHQRQKELGWDV
ncbi:hypothetical protein L204_103465 [Cryptococcus depauperatus]|nr:hypothetical protein L204_01781 [Cryptococcus depauperatus CBS 7855]